MGDPSAVLLGAGLPGAVILILLWAVRQLYTDNKALQKRIDDVQEARRVDAVQVNEKIVPVMNEFSQVASRVYSKLRSAKDE